MSTVALTDEQLLEAVQAFAEHGTKTKAALAMDVSRQTFVHRFNEAKRRGVGADILEAMPPKYVIKGQSILYNKFGEETGRWDKTTREGREPDEVDHVPDPKKITKVSTHTDQQGKVTQQWVTEKADDVERERLWRQFAEGLAADLPRAELAAAPDKASADLLAVYPVGDHHTGMLAWSAETGGANYDLAIAEQLLAEAAERLISTCPPCENALLAFLGDFTHYDSYDSVTPAHRNLLDADGRYPKMVETAVRMIRHMVAAALKRHQSVRVIFEKGNHDPATAAVLTILLAALYENEPRVSVDTSPQFFHYYEFGSVLIGTNHGDKVKADKLLAVMASDRPEAWGRTRHRVILTGHVHHEALKEYPGGTVESLPVLAPLDAYAAHGGWRSKRQMKAIVYHREHGEVERHTVNADMFERRAA